VAANGMDRTCGAEVEASDYQLPAIPYLRLRVTLQAGRSGRLPGFKGSLLRGAFGHALRRTVCVFSPDVPCPACSLRHACAYPRIFEPRIGEAEPPPFLRGLSEAPRPYIFEPATEARDFRVGDPLSFDLVLLGQSTELHAHALVALARMATIGLGEERIPFLLESAQAWDGKRGWVPLTQEGRLLPGAPLEPALPSTEPLPEGPLELRLATPTRIQAGGKLAETLPFRTLAFATLRRVLELAHFHVPGATPDWSFRSLLERSESVEVGAGPNLRWHDWQRYSQRQRREMKLGGLVGTLLLQGDLASFSTLLRTAEVVHIGKGTVFGLGKVEIRSAREAPALTGVPEQSRFENHQR